MQDEQRRIPAAQTGRRAAPRAALFRARRDDDGRVAQRVDRVVARERLGRGKRLVRPGVADEQQVSPRHGVTEIRLPQQLPGGKRRYENQSALMAKKRALRRRIDAPRAAADHGVSLTRERFTASCCEPRGLFPDLPTAGYRDGPAPEQGQVAAHKEKLRHLCAKGVQIHRPLRILRQQHVVSLRPDRLHRVIDLRRAREQRLRAGIMLLAYVARPPQRQIAERANAEHSSHHRPGQRRGQPLAPCGAREQAKPRANRFHPRHCPASPLQPDWVLLYRKARRVARKD